MVLQEVILGNYFLHKMEKITIQGKEFIIGKLKGKQMRLMSKYDSSDSLKFIEIILGVDEAFVDEMDVDEITLVSDIIEKVNPSLKKGR